VQNTPRTQQNGNQQTLVIAIIGIAVVVAVLFIIVSLGGTRATFGESYFADIPVEAFEGGYIIGNPDAAVTIVEFADYLCSHCQEYKPDMDKFIESHVATGLARVEFRLLPTAGGETTVYAGNLAYCAAEEGKHWGAITEIMYELAQTGQLSRSPASAFSEKIGVDVDKLLRCAQRASFVSDDRQLATSVGATATPTVMYRLNEGSLLPVSDRSYNGLVALVTTLSQ